MFKLDTKSWIAPTVFALLIAIGIFDITTAKGSADYIFLFVPVAMTFLSFNPMLPIQASIVASLFAVIGYIFSPVSTLGVNPYAIQNRSYTIITMLIVGFLVNRMIISKNANLRDSWLKSTANKLLDSVRGELTVNEIAERILSFLVEDIHALLGVIYVRNEDSDTFNYIGSHGVDKNKIRTSFKFGEGITGQVAIDQKIVNLTDLPSEHLKQVTGMGSSAPGAIKIVPLVADGKTIGLIELAFKEHPDASIREFFTLNVENLAIAFRSSLHKTKLAELLQQAQVLAEELQAQQEELRVSNEELEQQSQALRDSHARLENQQAEMEQTNQQLEEQTQILENQKAVLDEKNGQLESIHARLEEKAHELSRSSQYKSEFLANMSHELRTPLNSTLILAKLLSDNKPGNLSEEQVKYAKIIFNSGNDLLSLINDILDLSKVEAGKMTVHPEIVGVDQITKALDHMFQPIAKDKKLDFKIITDADLPSSIVTDRQRLEQIIRNFLSNAFKFTEKGGVTLNIYPDKGGISFGVTDTGLGISSDEQKVIFEAFRQADGTTNRKFGGTGLGLSISKELTRILGGEITVTSSKGQGSTFTLNIPLNFSTKSTEDKIEFKPHYSPRTEKVQEEKKEIIFDFEDDRKKIHTFPRRMLIVEDDPNFARILMDTAHEMKFGAVVTPSAEQGINLATQILPHAIVLDVRLPDHSGMIVLDQLKLNPKTRHIPVHVISSDDFSRPALEMGAMGYLLKPVKREQLLDAFKHLTSVMEQKLKHVLVVEDDEVQRMHIVDLIKDNSVEVEAVSTSKDALERLAKNTYDCMIMDLSLPDMSGHELLSKLSAENSVYSYPPVIVYTARDLTAEEEEKLRLYSGSIIIKGAKSPERLLSEVTLFLHKVENEMPPERQKMLNELRSREKNLEDRTLLIVDDDVRNIFALTSALEGCGAKIETARNGREAVDRMKNGSGADLILMDIMMPEMDGYEAMRQIRADARFKSLPIIALTAKAMSDDKIKCLDAGANDYLPKPIEMEKLMSLLRVWLPPKRRFIS